MTNPQKPKSQLAQVFPFERLYSIHRDINSYQQKWTKEKLFEAVFAPNNELTFTTLQYVNRVISVVGASAYLFGDANENKTYKKIGGSVAVASLYIEFLASYGKEKLFKVDGRQKKWDELIKDTENLGNSYQELAQIMKPIRSKNSLDSWHRLINCLKEETKNLVKKDGEGNLKETKLLKKWQNDSLSVKRITRWVVNLPYIFTRPLTKVSRRAEPWSKEWEERSIKRESIKNLLETLQEAISEYQQGIPNDEIEKKIERGIKKVTKKEIKTLDSTLENTLEIRKNMVQKVNNEENINIKEVAILMENHIESHS